MRPLFYPVFFFILLSNLLLPQADAKSLRDFPATHPPFRSGDRALFFAVNTYDKLNDLNNPVRNTREIARLLRDQYGFQTEVVVNATYDQIYDKLEAYERNYQNRTYNAQGQLLIFFSGHGMVSHDTGFFLGKDSDPKKLDRTAISYDLWRKRINQFNCRHILVAIDACFSVRFDPQWSSRAKPVYKKMAEFNPQAALLSHHQAKKSRIVFTSDGNARETPDQSNFAKKFITALQSGGGSDRMLTSTELYSFLETARPVPHCNEFGDDEAGSSFLFMRKRQTYTQNETDIEAWQKAERSHTLTAYRRYVQQFPRGDFVELAKKEIRNRDIAAWNQAKQAHTLTAYQSYISRFPNGVYKRVAESRRGELSKSSKQAPSGTDASSSSQKKDPISVKQMEPRTFSRTGSTSSRQQGESSSAKQKNPPTPAYRTVKGKVGSSSSLTGTFLGIANATVNIFSSMKPQLPYIL